MNEELNLYIVTWRTLVDGPTKRSALVAARSASHASELLISIEDEGIEFEYIGVATADLPAGILMLTRED